MTLTDTMRRALAQRGASTAMRWKRYGVWQTISGAETLRRVEMIARGLRAIGLADGDCAAVIGENCVEWVLADLGIVAAGGVSAGLDVHAGSDELARMLNDTGARVLFVAGDDQLHRAIALRADCPHLSHIIVMHDQWDDGSDVSGAITLADLEARGSDETRALPAPAPESIALIISTSGTTGPARGAIHRHRTVCRQAQRAAAALGLRADDERLSLTPMHHVLERVVGIYASLLSGTIVNFSESRETALANLVELQPTVVQASPQVWAALRSGIELAIDEATPLQRRACRAALSKKGVISDWLVLAPIRKRIGLARARLCLSGGAPLRDDVAAWFAALRRDLVDVYGHAETGGAVSIARSQGGVTPLDGLEIDTTAGDELRIRSDALFVGYVGELPVTLPDGWWPSGDVAAGETARARGRLIDMLVTGDGRRLAPFTTEAALTASPFIDDAFLHRDRGGRIQARILMNSDAVVKHAQDNGIPFTHFLSLCRSEEIRALIARAVDETNAKGTLRIEGFSLIERVLLPGDPALGPAHQLRRHLLLNDDLTETEHETAPNDLDHATP